ncbi:MULTISPECIES: DUF5590 domain-containing protein [Paenibacillus]|uniref:Cell wall elongation regulator TseB-like domain-containing protein n=1 Tax=Paenibacillus campinasensis TaxID=66347 RepID=A0A268F2Z8_9BACL|nr:MULTISPECIES: DUF5590 domain-containing protein [Paenibacillus]MUG65046.1 hypothetical protein [Paenibacillus campinasensis]PAD79755.1 hypothetical protein CHH67_03295 [Paenibacillus campinasensis]PAK53619.1 hypothetical protein CHH75_10255 [Paenibacillus sp. 7541]
MKKRTKWIWLSVSGVLLLLLGIQIYYSYVMTDSWNEERLAIGAARQYGNLVTADKSYKSVWGEDNTYWVVTGQGPDQQELIVWVKFTEDNVPVEGAEGVHAEPLSSGLSEEQMRAQILQEMPNAVIKRLVPGMYEGEYAWQLLYENSGQIGYRFYRFQDGNQIGNDIILPNQ